MKETFVAAVGCAMKERELEDVLAGHNNDYDYTVKMQDAKRKGQSCRFAQSTTSS